MNNRYFSIKDIEEISTENSDEFFYARIAVLSTRPNTHKVLITDDILKRDGVSVRGKWIVADPKQSEFMTHSKDEVIVGIVPHDAKIDFVEDEEGYTTMYVDAILSKIYATEVYRMFKEHSVRNVSVEMATEDFPTLEDGSIPIDGLHIYGITILGTFINGSCPNAQVKIVQFSEENAENYYKTFSENSESENSAEDSQETNKELNMKKKTEAMSMSDEQEKAEVTSNSVAEFAEPEKKEEGDKEDEAKESEDKDKEMSAECGKEMSCGDKEMSCGEDKQMAEDKTEEEAEDDSEKEDEKKEMSEESAKEFSEEEPKAEEKDKEFACLENEDAELSEGVRKVFSSDKAFAVESVLSMAKELKELKEFKAGVEQKEKEFAVDKVMAGVKSVLTEKEFDEFRKEGLACDNVDAFTNKVKAFAYDKKVESDTKDNGGIMEFADGQRDAQPKELTADEIFNKYM